MTPSDHSRSVVEALEDIKAPQVNMLAVLSEILAVMTAVLAELRKVKH